MLYTVPKRRYTVQNVVIDCDNYHNFNVTILTIVMNNATYLGSNVNHSQLLKHITT